MSGENKNYDNSTRAWLGIRNYKNQQGPVDVVWTQKTGKANGLCLNLRP